MAYDGRKIANSFFLPGNPILRGIAGLLAFTHSESQEFAEQLLSRTPGEAMRADWEAVGASMWWALGEYDKELRSKGLK